LNSLPPRSFVHRCPGKYEVASKQGSLHGSLEPPAGALVPCSKAGQAKAPSLRNVQLWRMYTRRTATHVHERLIAAAGAPRRRAPRPRRTYHRLPHYVPPRFEVGPLNACGGPGTARFPIPPASLSPPLGRACASGCGSLSPSLAPPAPSSPAHLPMNTCMPAPHGLPLTSTQHHHALSGAARRCSALPTCRVGLDPA